MIPVSKSGLSGNTGQVRSLRTLCYSATDALPAHGVLWSGPGKGGEPPPL